MLNRFAQVSADGAYNKPPHDKLSYGGMIFIRANMVRHAPLHCVAVADETYADRPMRLDPRQSRHHLVPLLHRPPPIRRPRSGSRSRRPRTRRRGQRRHQRQGSVGEAGHLLSERVSSRFAGRCQGLGVCHYWQGHGALLFSSSFSRRADAFAQINLFTKMASQLARGNTELLAETHAVSSGLKAYCTANTVEGMETARRAMGGHGFLESAGIGRLYASQLPSATYEGAFSFVDRG